MTPAQTKRFYFPAWRRAQQAQNWVMRKGRLQAGRKQRYGPDLHDQLYQAAWDAAERLAAANHRAVTDTDLRHGSHIAAFGRDISSKDLNNPQADRIVCLFRLFTDPDDLQAVLDWQNPDASQRRRYIASLKSLAPLAYIDAICRDMFAHIYQSPRWEDLPLSALVSLRRKIAARLPRSPEPESQQPADCPF